MRHTHTHPHMEFSLPPFSFFFPLSHELPSGSTLSYIPYDVRPRGPGLGGIRGEVDGSGRDGGCSPPQAWATLCQRQEGRSAEVLSDVEDSEKQVGIG